MSSPPPFPEGDAPAEATDDALGREVMPRLMRLSNALSRGRLTERAMESVDLRLDRPALSVLLTLHMADRPLRVGEIAQRMEMVGPHITRQVKELERRHLVRRVADPLDRRASLIEPTEPGAAGAARYVNTLFGWFAEAVANWEEEERRTFGRLLTRFADDFTARLAAADDRTPPASP